MMIYVKHLKTNELRSYDMDLAPVQVREAMEEYLPEHSMMKIMKRNGTCDLLYDYLQEFGVSNTKGGLACGIIIKLK